MISVLTIFYYLYTPFFISEDIKKELWFGITLTNSIPAYYFCIWIGDQRQFFLICTAFRTPRKNSTTKQTKEKKILVKWSNKAQFLELQSYKHLQSAFRKNNLEAAQWRLKHKEIIYFIKILLINFFEESFF